MIRTHHAAVRFNHDREDFTQHLQWQDDHRAGKWDKKNRRTDAKAKATSGRPYAVAVGGSKGATLVILC